MPSVAQGFKKPISSFNGEFTAMAHSTEEGIVICKKPQTDLKMKHTQKSKTDPLKPLHFSFNGSGFALVEFYNTWHTG